MADGEIDADISSQASGFGNPYVATLCVPEFLCLARRAFLEAPHGSSDQAVEKCLSNLWILCIISQRSGVNGKVFVFELGRRMCPRGPKFEVHFIFFFYVTYIFSKIESVAGVVDL